MAANAAAKVQSTRSLDRMGGGSSGLRAFTYSWIYAEPNGYDMSVVPFFNRVSGNSYEALDDPSSYAEKNDYPVKTAKEAGAILIAGSELPVLTNDPQPFVNMEMAVTRARHGLPPISPWQRTTIRDVLDAYTINGAHALGRASEIGSLEVGKSADFVVVNQDILALGDQGHAEKIGDTKVLEVLWEQECTRRERSNESSGTACSGIPPNLGRKWVSQRPRITNLT